MRLFETTTRETEERTCRTCNGVEPEVPQDEGEHEDELRGPLGEGLYEPQQAEVVAQVRGAHLGVAGEEAPQRRLHDARVSGNRSST